MQGICSEIDGAVHNPAMGAWIVPCTATPNVEVIMGNQKFPIHPLDLTHVDTWETSGVDHTRETSSFLTQFCSNLVCEIIYIISIFWEIQRTSEMNDVGVEYIGLIMN